MDILTKIKLNPDGTIDEEEALAIEALFYRATGENYHVNRKHNVLESQSVRIVPPVYLDKIEATIGFTPSGGV